MRHLQKNKLNVLFCLVSILLLPIIGFTQQKIKPQGYTIEAKIEGLPDGTRFYLTKASTSRSGLDTVTAANSLKGAFKFSGILPLQGEIHWILMDTTKFKLEKGKNNWLALMLDHSAIKLNGTAQQWPELKMEGSLPTTAWLDYIAFEKTQMAEIRALEASAQGDSTLAKKADSMYRRFTIPYYKANLDAYHTPRLIISNVAMNVMEKERFYQQLTPRVQNSYYGKELVKHITQEKHAAIIEKKQAELAVGKRMPDFNINSPDGKKLSVQDIASKADYTLIDFWASWCGPCRDAIPKIKEVYDAYRAKGFNVLGISTDTNGAAWKKALAEDATKWDHGQDNIDNAGKNIFGLAAIPAYILLDRKGVILYADYFGGKGGPKIIKQGEKTLSGDLKEIVAELLKGK